MIDILDIIWDDEFKEKTTQLKNIRKENDLAYFICPIIEMMANSKKIDEFIEEKCVTHLKLITQAFDEHEKRNVVAVSIDLIQSAFNPSWMLIYQIYIKHYLKEKYGIDAFIKLIDGELIARLHKNIFI